MQNSIQMMFPSFHKHRLFTSSADSLSTTWFLCEPQLVGLTMVTQPPRKQWVIVLKGEIEFETSDGEAQRLVPGIVVLAEDTTRKDHKA